MKSEKIFANHISDKGLIKRPKINKKTNLIDRQAEDLNRHFFQGRYTDGQRVHEKMFNKTNQQENANQNYNKILLIPYTCQYSYYQKTECEDVEKSDPRYTPGAATTKNCIEIPQKIKKIELRGIPWQSSGQNSTLSLPRARDRSLVGEQRSHKLCGVAQINIKKIKTEQSNDPAIPLLSIYPKEMKTLT